MAKFKVGDIVTHYSDKGNVGKIVEVKTYPAGQVAYKVKMPSGIVYEWQEFEMVKNAVCNAKFEVGKVYRAPWDRDWLCKVLSRTDSSVKCAIKSVRDKSWGPNDEIVTLRIQPKQTKENGSEVIKGQDWEFWADVTNSEVISMNAEVKDAKGNVLKDGDYAIVTVGNLKGKRVKIVSIHSRANIYITDPSGSVKIIDGEYLVKNSVTSTNAIVNAAIEWKAKNSVEDLKSDLRKMYLDRAETAVKMGDMKEAEDWRMKTWELEKFD